MVNDTWTVYWEEFMSDSYGYGSEVEFNKILLKNINKLNFKLKKKKNFKK